MPPRQPKTSARAAGRGVADRQPQRRTTAAAIAEASRSTPNRRKERAAGEAPMADDRERGAALRDGVLRVQKYPNRRLYDRTTSRHLTHEQLYDLVAGGRRVQVTDSRTGEEITNLVLAQVLLERDPLKLAAFPSELFHLIIRTNHRLIPSVQRAMFDATAALSSGWGGWGGLENRFPAIPPLTAAANPLTWWLGGKPTSADPIVTDASSLVATAAPTGAHPAPPATRSAAQTANGPANAEAELADLRAELAELESRISAVRSAVAPTRTQENRSGQREGSPSGSRAGRGSKATSPDASKPSENRSKRARSR